jgi:hypothetical protein
MLRLAGAASSLPATRLPLRLLRQLRQLRWSGSSAPAFAFLLKCHSQCFAISSIL